jgi:hypothetical protein
VEEEAGHVSPQDLSLLREPRAAVAAPPDVRRRRLSRTFSGARWSEYRTLLTSAAAAGYRLVSLEDWLLEPDRWAGEKLLLLRHDVDQHPRSALAVAAIERDLGLTSTWYFRWRTASAPLIADLRRGGNAVGLHYETLTRQVRARDRVPARELERLIPGARHVLRGEIAAFVARHGAIRSVCPHGDSRVPGVRNADLLLDEDWTTYGVELDAHLAMRRHDLGAWMTDRSLADGGWKDGLDPSALLTDGVTPILCLVHPNNWASGPSLWTDRVFARLLPAPSQDPAQTVRLMRTGTDLPPI